MCMCMGSVYTTSGNVFIHGDCFQDMQTGQYICISTCTIHVYIYTHYVLLFPDAVIRRHNNIMRVYMYVHVTALCMLCCFALLFV